MVDNLKAYSVFVFFVFVMQMLYQGHAYAETKKVALVVGNDSYVHAPSLSNPVHDATAISALLKKIGFDVIERFDADKEALEQALELFAERSKDSEIGLVYFAGHGIQYEGVAYLIPTDVSLDDDRELRRLIPAEYVVQDAARASKLGLLILDACRDNPFVKRLAESVGTTRSMVVSRGLKRVSGPPSNALIAYSTQSGNVALDGDPGEHSPYAKALLMHLGERNKDVRLVFGAIRDEVISMSGRQQEPYTYGSLSGNEIHLYSDSPQSSKSSEFSRNKEPTLSRMRDAPALITSAYGHWAIATSRDSWGELVQLSRSTDHSLFPFLAKTLLDERNNDSGLDLNAQMESLKRSGRGVALSSNTIAIMQSNLRGLNYYSGRVSGVLDNNSRSALYAFLGDNGLDKKISFNALLTLAMQYEERGAESGLTGRWRGRYYYPRTQNGVKSVGFEMDLTFSQGNVTGFVSEPNTFGDSSSKNLYASFKGRVVGNHVEWIKQYDGTGGVNHSVKYTGVLDRDAGRVAGRWEIGKDWSGDFYVEVD